MAAFDRHAAVLQQGAALDRAIARDVDGAVVRDRAADHGRAIQRQRVSAVDLDRAVVVDGAADDLRAIQYQRLSGVDRQRRAGIGKDIAVNRAVAGNIDGAEIVDRAAGQFHPAQVQRRAGIDLDRAVVGDRRARHRGAVQRQRLGGIHLDPADIHIRAVDRAVAGDLDGAGAGDTAVRDRRAACQVKHCPRIDLNDAGIVDGHTIERRTRACRTCLDFKQTVRTDSQVPADDRGAVIDNQFAVKGYCVDLNDAGGVIHMHIIERRTRGGLNVYEAGIGEYSTSDAGIEIKRQRAGDFEHAAGVDNGLAIQRIAGAADIDLTGIAEHAVLQHGVAGKIDDAVGVVDDGAAVDARRIQRQRGSAVDRDVAAGVADRGAQIEQQRAAGQNFKGMVGGDGLLMQRIVGAADLDLTGIAERAVLQHGAAGEVDLAVIGDGPAIDGGRAKRQLRIRLDRHLAGIGDIDLNIEHAAGYVDRSGDRVRDRAVVFEIAAVGERNEAGILQHACIQHFHQVADADGSRIIDNRVRGKTKHATDGQRALVDQLRGRRPEVIHGHGFGECRRIDGDRIRRCQAPQLIGDDDDIIVQRWNGPGFPVRRIAPQPSRRRAGGGRGDPDHGGRGGAGDRDNDVLTGSCALRIRYRHRIGERQCLALGDEIRQKNRQVGKLPVDGSSTCSRTVGGNGCGEGLFKRRHWARRKRLKRQLIKCRGAISGERCAGQVGRNRCCPA